MRDDHGPGFVQLTDARITDSHLRQALADALRKIALETRILYSAESFTLAHIESPTIEYLYPPVLIPRGYGTAEKYRHPNDPMRMTVRAVWRVESHSSTVELRARAAVDLTAEQFALDDWSISDGYALEWQIERQSLSMRLDLDAGARALDFRHGVNV